MAVKQSLIGALVNPLARGQSHADVKGPGSVGGQLLHSEIRQGGQAGSSAHQNIGDCIAEILVEGDGTGCNLLQGGVSLDFVPSPAMAAPGATGRSSPSEGKISLLLEGPQQRQRLL